MDIFEVHRRIMDDYASYIRSFVSIADDEMRTRVEQHLDEGRLWPEPLLTFNPSFAKVGRIEELVSSGEAIGITSGHLRDFAKNAALPDGMMKEVQQLAGQYNFFHWHLAFPEVFKRDGFDVILGNPPWERVKLQEKEWFAERRPDIADAPNSAARKRLIESLRTDAPELFAEFQDGLRQADGESHLMRHSGLYPLCGRGDINLYAVFAERMRNVLGLAGRVGAVLPSGIATGDTTKMFFQNLVETKSLVSLLSFFEIRLIFLDTDSREPFSLFTAGSGKSMIAENAEFVWFARSVNELSVFERRFTLSASDIALIKPNTKTCPVFQTRRDAEITKRIYRQLPILIREGDNTQNPWGVEFGTMLHMSNDSGLFKTYEELIQTGAQLVGNHFVLGNERCLPLYEQNLIHLIDHRFATFRTEAGSFSFSTSRQAVEAEHADASGLAMPRYWVREQDIADVLRSRYGELHWTLAFRRSARSNDARTALFCCLPEAAVGDSVFLLSSCESDNPERLALLLGQLTSMVFDFAARQSIGGENASFFIMKQLPVLQPILFSQPCAWSGGAQTLKDWLLSRVLELTYTAWDLEAFAQDCGWSGPPFRWAEERRFQLRCELDAAFFHLYGLMRCDSFRAAVCRLKFRRRCRKFTAKKTPHNS